MVVEENDNLKRATPINSFLTTLLLPFLSYLSSTPTSTP